MSSTGKQELCVQKVKQLLKLTYVAACGSCGAAQKPSVVLSTCRQQRHSGRQDSVAAGFSASLQEVADFWLLSKGWGLCSSCRQCGLRHTLTANNRVLSAVQHNAYNYLRLKIMSVPTLTWSLYPCMQ